jgi:hypothetical protein
MIGSRNGNRRSVSGEGGSCFYRAIAYQLAERGSLVYYDAAAVRNLRQRVREFLRTHARDRVPGNEELRWRDIGGYQEGYAEAPVPQAMAYVVGCPVTVHLGENVLPYGQELPGEPLNVRLQGLHYSIQYLGTHGR